jgi:hypothetical protein
MKKQYIYIGSVLAVLLLAVGVSGCSYTDPLDNMFTKDILPGKGLRANIGSVTNPYSAGYFDNLTLDGVPLRNYETDPVYSSSVAASITSANVTVWNTGAAGAWTVDANGINYDAGSVGIGTPSEAAKIVLIYDNHGTANKALSVESNNANAGTIGIYSSVIGAKTGDTYGMRISNATTSVTNNIKNYGLYISNVGTWGGLNTINYGLYIAPVTGAATNVGAFIDSATDLSDNDLNNVLKLNLTDPTELTINAGVITKTQGFHTVDTESDAATDDLVTVNGGVTGDMLVLSGASDTREVRVTRTGNVRFQPDHLIEFATFTSPAGSSGTFYTGGFYAAPAADANLTNASTTVSYGTANSPTGVHMFLVAGGAGTTNAGTVSIVVSGTTITDAGVRAAGTETIVANITTMAANKYYETTKRWLGTVTYTLTPAGGATVFAADFNYGKCVYDSIDSRHFNIKQVEMFGRAGANDTNFDIQILHHKATGWTYSAAAFVPGTSPLASLIGDYATDNDLVSNERFTYDRSLNQPIDGTAGEGFLFRIITTANKAVEFMDIGTYIEAIPNDKHLKSTGQAIQLIYNGTNWCEN